MDEYDTLLPILHYTLGMIPKPDPGIVLDLACGRGRWAGLIASHCGRPPLGIDIDVAALQASVGAFTWRITGDAQALPLRDHICAAVYCIAALGVFPDRLAALREIRRIVAPAGWVLLVTATQVWAPVVRWPARLAEQLIGLYQSLPITQWGAPTLEAYDLVSDLRDVLGHSGFSITWVRSFLMDDSSPPLYAELPLLPWPKLRSLVADQLNATELAHCDQVAAEPEIELCSIIQVAWAST